MARICTLALILFVAACGFQPVYGPGGTGTLLQNRVLIDKPSDREGFLLVRHLEDRLGRTANPAYTLSVTLYVTQEDRAIDPDGDIRRFHLIVSPCAVIRFTQIFLGLPPVAGALCL